MQERDAVGNWSASGSCAVTVDATPPTVSITSTAPGTINSSPIPVTITFSENVAEFEVGDLTVENGSAGNFSGSRASYPLDITPTANGMVTVDVAANVAQDTTGNNNTATTPLSRTYDASPPAVSITSTALGITNSSPIPVLTADLVSRTTAATMKFTSKEAGAHYYRVVANGSAAPTIDTSGAGTACSTSETTISFSLTAVAKDVYIKVKDATGNVRDALKIDIAAYGSSHKKSSSASDNSAAIMINGESHTVGSFETTTGTGGR